MIKLKSSLTIRVIELLHLTLLSQRPKDLSETPLRIRQPKIQKILYLMPRDLSEENSANQLSNRIWLTGHSKLSLDQMTNL